MLWRVESTVRRDLRPGGATQRIIKTKIVLSFSDSSASLESEANGREETKRKRIISHRDRRERREKEENNIMVFLDSSERSSEAPHTGQAGREKNIAVIAALPLTFTLE